MHLVRADAVERVEQRFLGSRLADRTSDPDHLAMHTRTRSATQCFKRSGAIGDEDMRLRNRFADDCACRTLSESLVDEAMAVRAFTLHRDEQVAAGHFAAVEGDT